jgi:signal transduction histidine kinase
VAQISQFTDNASHQLLNPLTAIRSEIEYSLKKERTISEYHDTLALINQQTSKMIDIINTLLLISKPGRDESIRNSIFNLTNSLENACKDFEARKIALLQPEKTIYIKGTDQYFTIVIENLIENAAKYSTPEKDITIRVTEVSGEVVVAVEDFGIGIPPEEREAIFTRFYRSGQSERIGIKGYGLGLSLAKTIVENMGGRITLKDNIPAGSIFSLHFPRIMGE